MQSTFSPSLELAIMQMARGEMGSIGERFLSNCSSEFKVGWRRLRAATRSLFACDAECKRMFAELFLDNNGKISLLPAQYQHKAVFDPSLSGHALANSWTPPTRAAADSFSHVIDKVESKIEEIDHWLTCDGKGTLISFGSPTSNLITRTTQQCEEKADAKRGYIYTPSLAYQLPVRFELNADAIEALDSPYGKCKRVERNGASTMVTNWGIHISNKGIWLPITRSNGDILKDYLLISCLPNIFNLDSCVEGGRAISFGGTHSEGTKAIEQLFTNKAILTKLCEEVNSVEVVNGTRYWQTLISVNCEPDTSEVSLGHVEGFWPVKVEKEPLYNLAIENQDKFDKYKR